ncbi:MAG: hypothetical protein EAX90_02135 [Candidatus Heimdallarchaeota archaeon]|nr:hypothetical protein [Candidatus Heimdallarchaeota archaeon]
MNKGKFLAFFIICLFSSLFFILQFSDLKANNNYVGDKKEVQSIEEFDSHLNYNYSEIAIWGDIDDIKQIESIFVKENIAYLGGYGGFYIVNITEPDNPFMISEISFGDYLTGGIVWGIYVEENYVYLAKSDTALIVVNISNIEAPIIDSYVLNPHCAGYRSLYVNGDYFYLIGTEISSLSIFKLDSNKYPHFITFYQHTDIDYVDIATSGNYLFLSTLNDRIEILNISDKSHPTFINTINLPRNTLHLEIKDNLLFTAIQYNGFRVFDFTNISNIVEVARDNPYLGDHAIDFAINDTMLYVGYLSDGMDMIDFSNISNMKKVGHFWGNGPITSIQLKDNLIYSVHNRWGLSIAGRDKDNDNLPDYLEKKIGTDELDPDSDNDRLLDGQEYWEGGNPLVWNNWKLLFGVYFIPIYVTIIGVIIYFTLIRKRK